MKEGHKKTVNADMKKTANHANLVREHLCEQIWTFCQNSNKSISNHTFFEQIDCIDGRNFKISNDLIQMVLSSPIFS